MIKEIIENYDQDQKLVLETLELILQEIKTSRKPNSLGWLNNEQFCDALKISKRTAQNYRDQGLIPFSSTAGKVYYRVADVETFLSANYTGIKNKK